MDESRLRFVTIIEAIRKRPGMYVGSTDFFGLVHYFVSPVALLLAQSVKRIELNLDDPSGMILESDALMPIVSTESGKIIPFEESRGYSEGLGLEGTVFNALSSSLTVISRYPSLTETFRFVQGVRESRDATESLNPVTGTTFRFKPDNTIFPTAEVSTPVFESYFRRLSYLHAGVRFSIVAEGQRREFFAEDGLAGLFAAVASPYQYLHEPIHFVAVEDTLRMELVMAYQSWEDDHLWCFINNGRAVEGGTHEKGLRLALAQLRKRLGLPKGFRNGVVAVASIHYPGATWEGCIKARIGNPELKESVCRLVVEETTRWIEVRPDVLRRIRGLQTFTFPDAWSS